MHRVMVIDDEESILKSLGRTLRRVPDLEVEFFSNSQEALRRARTTIFDAFITDCNMPGCNGIEFLTELRDIQPDACRILLTGMVDVDTLMKAINQAGAFRFYAKPWEDNQLIEGLQEGLRLRDALTENRILADRLRDQQAELERYRMKSVG